MQDPIPTGAWIVVADGTGARVLTNEGEGGALSLRQREVLVLDLDNTGPAGIQPPETTRADNDEATFAKQLAQRLNDGALRNEYDHLVLMADPRTLGQMRPLLHKETCGRLLAEVDRDLRNAPLERIERALH